MKKYTCLRLLLPILFLCLLLTGCMPDLTSPRNTEYDSNSQICIGGITIDAPQNGLELYDNKDILASDGMYYVTWTMGEHESYTNSEHKTADLYDTQLYLLVRDCEQEENALSELAGWQELLRKTYTVSDTEELTVNGQTYTSMMYPCDGDPYAAGMAAFTVYDGMAVSIELYYKTSPDSETELKELLTDFLSFIHYSKEG